MNANAEVGERATDQSCINLLIDDVQHDGWEHSIALGQSYYVRGATWFKNNVLKNDSELKNYVGITQKRCKSLDGSWLIRGVNWNERFSYRQAAAALSLKKRAPLSFQKAVQTIMLCEDVLNELRASGEIQGDLPSVVSRMHIEPAVFYICDFDLKTLGELKKARPNLQAEARDFCGQVYQEYLHDMAWGNTVTRRLASKTREFLLQVFPEFPVGAVDYRARPNPRSASVNETLI